MEVCVRNGAEAGRGRMSDVTRKWRLCVFLRVVAILFVYPVWGRRLVSDLKDHTEMISPIGYAKKTLIKAILK